MATFLELVREAVRESGTVSDPDAPATVVGQQGRLLRFVNWTRDAYRLIQTYREDWVWLRARFSGAVSAGIVEYDGGMLGAGDRLARFIPDAVSYYATAEGAAGEGFLRFFEWEDFSRELMIGTRSLETGKPAIFTITPAGLLRVWPTPDAPGTIRGEYWKSPQRLMLDADRPEMPATHHDAIKYRALTLMAEHDEALEQHPYWMRQYADLMAGLVRTQTPRIRIGGPLA